MLALYIAEATVYIESTNLSLCFLSSPPDGTLSMCSGDPHQTISFALNSANATPTHGPDSKSKDKDKDYGGLDFKIVLDSKSENGSPTTIHLVAPTLQEKTAWISDISQVSGILQTLSSSSGKHCEC